MIIIIIIYAPLKKRKHQPRGTSYTLPTGPAKVLARETPYISPAESNKSDDQIIREIRMSGKVYMTWQ